MDDEERLERRRPDRGSFRRCRCPGRRCGSRALTRRAGAAVAGSVSFRKALEDHAEIVALQARARGNLGRSHHTLRVRRVVRCGSPRSQVVDPAHGRTGRHQDHEDDRNPCRQSASGRTRKRYPLEESRHGISLSPTARRGDRRFRIEFRKTRRPWRRNMRRQPCEERPVPAARIGCLINFSQAVGTRIRSRAAFTFYPCSQWID